MQKLIQRYNSMMGQGLSIRAMARMLNLAPSTVQGHLAKIKAQGNLVHGNTGKRNRPPNPNKGMILRAAEQYYDFSISHMQELLAERDGLVVNPETLRRWLARPRKHKRAVQRQRRDAKPNFGEMLQIDGSFHDWFGGIKTCLINIVDDATKITEMRFDEQETIESACRAAWAWFNKYGVPESFYADGRNMYHVLETENFFTSMCKTLGIRVIMAHSAQAKGRVERSNRTHQDRLVPLMRLDGVDNIADANRYLENYLIKHNRKFSQAALGGDVHRPLPEWAKDIDDVCVISAVRTLNNDWTFSYKNRICKIPRQSVYPPAKSKIVLKITLSGKITASYRCSVFNVE